MLDPLEGLTDEGIIRTGAAREMVPAEFEPVLAAALERVAEVGTEATLYLYGSVATGQAVPGFSDVDFVTIGLGHEAARQFSDTLTAEFATLCRAVEIGAADRDDFEGDGDEAYGGRVFLRHYCVHLGGPMVEVDSAGYPGDRRAACGFNGDIGLHAGRWRRTLDDGDDGGMLGRRVARKTLLAVAGLVSIHDNTWTTDRWSAAARWAELRPHLAVVLGELVRWSDGGDAPGGDALRSVLDGAVDELVRDFAATIGLWR